MKLEANNPFERHEVSFDLRTALDIAERAGLILLKHHGQDVETQYKGGDAFDPVTLADMESDVLIRKLLSESFSGDLILSEENPDIPTNYEGRVWLVDPLDATKEYKAGGDGYSVHIGLWENNRLVLGVVSAPARKMVWYAERGNGAFLRTENGTDALHTSGIMDIAQARMITRNPTADIRPLDELTDRLSVRERLPEGSVGIKLSRIAQGEAEIHLNTNFRASKWDTGAPQVILEEAGGVITDLDGNPLDYTQEGSVWTRSFVASANRELHERVLEAIKA
jgi:3'(2'), 5'-bisphosphate nucleotidase